MESSGTAQTSSRDLEDQQSRLASGANCLLHLIRHLLTITDVDRETSDTVLFRHAALLSSDIPAMDLWRSLATEIWKREPEDVPAQDSKFLSLMSLNSMRLVWSNPLFCPWRQPLWKTKDEECWHAVTADNTPDVVVAAYGSRDLLCRLSAFPGMNLEAQINGRSGFKSNQEIYTVLPAIPSKIIVCLFDVGSVTQHRKLSFDDFRTFKLKVVSPVRRTPMTVRYNLVAIVKCQNRADDAGDSIRIYRANGRPLHPTLSPFSHENSNWKIQDLQNGDKLFAVFANSFFEPESEPAFTEVVEEMRKVDPEYMRRIGPMNIDQMIIRSKLASGISRH